MYVIKCLFCYVYVILLSVLLCEMCVYLLIKCCFSIVIFVFTQVNKALARSLSMCLGEDVMVITGYIPAAPTFFH